MKSGTSSCIKRLSAALIIFTISFGAYAGPIFQTQHSGASQILAASPLGQSFTAEDASISSIGFFIEDFNAHIAPNDHDLSVVLYNGGAGAVGPAIKTVTINNIANGHSDWLDFDFSDVLLTVGNLYSAMVIDNTVRWGARTNQHSFTNGNPISGKIDYVGGHAIVDGNIQTFRDMTFRILTPTNVPEPGTLALFVFGLMGLGFMKRTKLS